MSQWPLADVAALQTFCLAFDGMPACSSLLMAAAMEQHKALPAMEARQSRLLDYLTREDEIRHRLVVAHAIE